MLKTLRRQPLNKKDTIFYNNTAYPINFVPYIPAAIAIKIGSIFKSSPVWLGWWARIGSLAAYLALVFVAIRIIPFAKLLVLVFALTPMVLFQAASVTYDTLSIALCIVLAALALQMRRQNISISWKQLSLYLLVALFHRFAKDGYLLVPFIILVVPISKFCQQGTVRYIACTFFASVHGARLYLGGLFAQP